MLKPEGSGPPSNECVEPNLQGDGTRRGSLWEVIDQISGKKLIFKTNSTEKLLNLRIGVEWRSILDFYLLLFAEFNSSCN